MKRNVSTLLLCVIAVMGSILATPDVAFSAKFGPVGRVKSDNSPSGPVVGGLALSLTTSTEHLKRRQGGYVWLSLELRNTGAKPRSIKGLGTLVSIEPIVTDASGRTVANYEYPKTDTYAGPADSSGVPIQAGSSLYFGVPIDAMVDFPKAGAYSVRIRTVHVLDAQSGSNIDLISNPLSITISRP